jgi:membrane protein
MASEPASPPASEPASPPASPSGLRQFGKRAWDSNITGLSSMLAYNMLLGVVPVVLSSHTVTQSMEQDLRDIFPGIASHTLQSLLDQVSDSTTTTGILALIFSLWLASSFWGALDTSFSRIYHYEARPWLKQKRFGIVMVGVVLLFMIATVLIPTTESLLKAGASHLPLDLSKIHAIIYVLSLVLTLAILFSCLAVIYSTVPNGRVPWHGVWPGALSATVAIFIIDIAFPLYLTSISTIARFGTTIVFIVLVLGWFYLVAMIILLGAIMNALWLDRRGLPVDT